MATAGDQINRALRLLGVLAEGDIPSADTSADALVALNQMLDSWSTERLSVFTKLTQTVTWPAGDVARSIGPSGYFSGLRPVLLDDATYYTFNGVDYPIEIINQEQYNSIPLKTAGSSLPDVIYCDMALPDATLYLYPSPSSDIELHIVSVTPLEQLGDISTNLVIPPGYLRAFTYNLAVELAPEFGVAAPKDVKDIAKTSKRNIKRINNPRDVMGMPAALLPRRYGYNILTGPY